MHTDWPGLPPAAIARPPPRTLRVPRLPPHRIRPEGESMLPARAALRSDRPPPRRRVPPLDYSQLRAGLAEVNNGPNLDRAQLGKGHSAGNPHRIIEVVRLDEDEATQTLLGFHERTVGGRHLSVADPDGDGFIWERQRFARYPLAAGPELGVMGPYRAQDGLCLGTLIEHDLGIEIDQADIPHARLLSLQRAERPLSSGSTRIRPGRNLFFCPS